MKKLVLIALFAFSTTLIFAQDKVKDTSYWQKSGKVSLLFNQSAFSNWTVGGDSNLAGNFGVHYSLNYKKDKITWINRVDAAFGLSKTENNEFTKKTDDRLELNSVFGIKAKGYWSYSFFANFKTQFAKGYEYSKDANGKEIRKEYTNFMSPGYLSLGPGLLWEKHSNFKFNLSPLAVKLIFVDPNYTLPDNKYFGVDEGESLRTEFGFRASAYAKFTLVKNVSVENILSLYSNYLEDAQNIDIDYTMSIDMTINEVLSANLIFQTIYDDNAYQGFQIREVFGLGVNYSF